MRREGWLKLGGDKKKDRAEIDVEREGQKCKEKKS